MQRVLPIMAVILSLAAGAPTAAQQVTGSGSTLAYPIVAKWAAAYKAATGIEVAYQPEGSALGETDIRSDVVDFAVTDAPLVDAQLLRDGLAQFPVVMGAIVPVVNLDGIAPGRLHLTGTALAEIYLGHIKTWRDPAITVSNPGIELPDRPILVIWRTDGSGTTFNWTDYLSRVSETWKASVGSSTKVAWPAGVGAKGGAGVALAVSRVKGAIGYLEFSTARHAGLTYALAQNLAGHFVPPDAQSYAATTTAVDWAGTPDFAVLLTGADGPNAYPLMATSFALIRRYSRNKDRTQAVLNFFRWTMASGQDTASAMDYLPLPASLTRQVETYWQTVH